MGCSNDGWPITIELQSNFLPAAEPFGLSLGYHDA